MNSHRYSSEEGRYLSPKRKINTALNHGERRKKRKEAERISEVEPLEMGDSVKLENVSGRRIIDIRYFIEQLQALAKHSIYDCNFSHMDFISESRKGLRSGFKFKCKVCWFEKTIWTENLLSESNLNVDAVAGLMSMGCRYADMEKLFTSMNIPCMTNNTLPEQRNAIPAAVKQRPSPKLEAERATKQKQPAVLKCGRRNRPSSEAENTRTTKCDLRQQDQTLYKRKEPSCKPNVENTSKIEPDVENASKIEPDVENAPKIEPNVENASKFEPDVENASKIAPDVLTKVKVEPVEYKEDNLTSNVPGQFEFMISKTTSLASNYDVSNDCVEIGRNIAAKLLKMDPMQRIYAESIIDTVLDKGMKKELSEKIVVEEAH